MTTTTQAPDVAALIERIESYLNERPFSRPGDLFRDAAEALARQSQEIETLRSELKSARNGLDAEGKAHWHARDALAAAQEQIAAMREARNAIELEHAKVAGDDGYNYAAGQEYGLRFALIKLDAALTAPQAPAPEGVWISVEDAVIAVSCIDRANDQEAYHTHLMARERIKDAISAARPAPAPAPDMEKAVEAACSAYEKLIEQTEDDPADRVRVETILRAALPHLGGR